MAGVPVLELIEIGDACVPYGGGRRTAVLKGTHLRLIARRLAGLSGIRDRVSRRLLHHGWPGLNTAGRPAVS